MDGLVKRSIYTVLFLIARDKLATRLRYDLLVRFIDCRSVLKHDIFPKVHGCMMQFKKIITIEMLVGFYFWCSLVNIQFKSHPVMLSSRFFCDTWITVLMCLHTWNRCFPSLTGHWYFPLSCEFSKNWTLNNTEDQCAKCIVYCVLMEREDSERTYFEIKRWTLIKDLN